jgi:hypothetical protein
MRRLYLLFCLGFLAAGTIAVRADDPQEATTADIRELQREVDRLDANLMELDDENSRAAEFRQREDDIRDRLTAVTTEARRRRDGSPGPGVSKSEVDDLRRSVADLRTDIDESVGGHRGDRGTAGRVSVPDGTDLVVRLDDRVSSRTARPDDRVEATVAESVRVDGQVAIPAGATVVGTVRDVVAAERPAHGGRVDLSFGTLVTSDGTPVRIPARVVSVKEGGIDKSKAGLGALVGGILGAVVDGGKGAIIGAVLGGGGAVVASKGEEVDLPPGTVLTLRLEEPVTIARGASGS